MMYAAQNNVVRWFFTEAEINYLFDKVNIKRINPPLVASISINGNWKKGYAFRPIISHNPDSVSHFPIVKMPDNQGGEIYHFATPVRALSISQAELATLTSADVIAKPATDGRHALVVFPTETRPKLHLGSVVRPVYTTDKTKPQIQKIQTTTVSSTVVAEEAVTETIIEEALTVDDALPQQKEAVEDIEPLQATVPDNEQVAWAKLLVEQINADLALTNGITPMVAEDGKSIRFMRRIAAKRQVV
jgi:hypothetical protein